MLRSIFLSALASLALLSGCASSGFAVATKAGTTRSDSFFDTMLLQAANDLEAINDCYLRASGYARVLGASNAVTRVGVPTSAESCTVMAGMLRTQSNMLTAFSGFLVQPMMPRVPAAPEEIAVDIAKFGIKASLAKFGIESVSKVITSGQAATTQIASEGIAAAAKPPLVIEVPAPVPAEVPAVQ